MMATKCLLLGFCCVVLLSLSQAWRIRHKHYGCYDDEPTLANGYYEVISPDGGVIRAYCHTGFQLVGERVRRCDASTKNFTGSDPSCEDFNECDLLKDASPDDEEEGSTSVTLGDEEDELTPCHHNATCTNTAGSYKCICDEGWRGDGYHCTEIGEYCSELLPPQNGWSRTISDRGDLHFYCRYPYVLVGSSQVSCVQGRWTHQVPVCLKPDFHQCGVSSYHSNQTSDNETEPAPKGAWPWLAGIGLYPEASTEFSPMCGGALICDNWIVTSASCVDSLVKLAGDVQIWVRLGAYNQTSKEISTQTVPVAEIVRHPQYTAAAGTVANDIAVLRMNTTITLNKCVRTVCVSQEKKESKAYRQPGTPALLAGWALGETPGGGDLSSQPYDVIRQIWTTIADNQTCTTSLTDHIICTDNRLNGDRKCLDNLDGPLVVKGDDSYFRLAGVAIYGNCGVFTDVGEHMTWIHLVTKGCSLLPTEY